MSRMWEILEKDHKETPRRKVDDDELEKAYRCGLKDGYKKAIEELEDDDFFTREQIESHMYNRHRQ